MKRMLTEVGIVFLAIFVTSCMLITPIEVPVTSISILPATLGLSADGSTETLTADIAPADATDTGVTWSSDNPTVASVLNGVVTPLAAGTATITVSTTDGSKTADCDVTVTNPEISVTGVSVSPTALSMTAGGSSKYISATVLPGNSTDKSVIWSSDNPTVASVLNGVVTPLTAGTVTITVSTTDGSKTADCDVTVHPDVSLTVVNSNANFVQYKVSQAEFDLWNSESMTSDSGKARIKVATAAIYEMFYDKFDFVFFMMNNSARPPGRPYGQAFQTRNDVAGLGDYLKSFDYSAEYGSEGQLQHIVALYKLRYSAASSSSYLITGPTIHEIGHRWFNFSSTYFYGSHWPTGTITDGIFGGAWNNMAEIELYLMGLIDYADITDGSTDKTYADAFISESGIRSPGTANSQKSFRGLVVVVTPEDMTSEEISITDHGVSSLTSLTNTDPANGANFYRQTGFRATLKLNGLEEADTRK